MSEPIFRGAGVALVTLFDSTGEVDAAATADLARRLVDAGVRAVVVAGSTGEAGALSLEERTELLVAVRGAVPADVAVLAGTGAPSARQAVTLTKAAFDSGADAVLVLSPPGSSDVRPYYEDVAKAAAGQPVLAYHYVASSAPGIPPSMLPQLPVDGVKDSSGEPARLYEEVDTFPGWIYIGSASLVLLAGALDCAGAILAIANTHPEASVRALAGDASAQREIAAASRQLSAWPQGLKDAVAARFGTSPVCRMG